VSMEIEEVMSLRGRQRTSRKPLMHRDEFWTKMVGRSSKRKRKRRKRTRRVPPDAATLPGRFAMTGASIV